MNIYIYNLLDIRYSYVLEYLKCENEDTIFT